MVNKRVLLISGSLGLGHKTCDLAFADGLKDCNGQVVVDWLAAPPANQMIQIQHAGEHMLAASNQRTNNTVHAEETAAGHPPESDALNDPGKLPMGEQCDRVSSAQKRGI
jgi:hypothetical protein